MVFERENTTFGDPEDEEDHAPVEEEEPNEKEEKEEEVGKEKVQEKIVDPLETVRQKCEQTEHCIHARQKLEACEARVSSRSQTTEECTEELFDFLRARDRCVIHRVFKCLK